MRSTNERDQYYVKCIEYGSYIDRYEYELPVIYNLTREKKKKVSSTLIDYDDINQKNYNRTKNNLLRLVSSNPDLDLFVTLTFKKNITELDEANPLFHKFVMRLRCLYSDIKYIAVPEFQKRGAVHYHLLSSGRYLPHNLLSSLWSHGFIKIKSIRSVDHLGSYISKYISKAMYDQLKGKKKYFTSRNVVRPKIFLDDRAVGLLSQPLIELSRFTFQARFVGSVQKITYRKVN